MGSISIGGDLGKIASRHRTGTRLGQQAKKWMEMQSGNVLAEARNVATDPGRLEEIALNATKPAQLSVASNRSATPAALLHLSTYDVLTGDLAKRLTRNPNTPRAALVNIRRSIYASWWGNAEKITRHANGHGL